MSDNFALNAAGLSSPCSVHYPITPNDDADLPQVPRQIVAIADGDVVIRDRLGTDITYPVMAGDQLAFRGVRILATGTTATVVGWE